MNNKRKRTTLWREVGFGSIALLIASPLIAFALVYAVFAFIAGFSYLSKGLDFAPQLITASGLSIVGLVYVLVQIVNRYRQIRAQYQVRHTNIENDTIYDEVRSAERLLMDTDAVESPAIDQQQISPRKDSYIS